MSKVLSVRVDRELATRLRAVAQANGWTEGQVVRYFVQTALGDEAQIVAFEQTVKAVQARFHERASYVSQQIGALLEAELLEPYRGAQRAPQGGVEGARQSGRRSKQRKS